MADLAQLIAQFEGFYVPGSLAQRNNNPGNLRAGPGRYAIFPDVQTGWRALYNQIQLDANRGMDVQSFIYSYAPPSENNTQNYLSFLLSKLGVTATTLLSELGTGSPPVNPRIPPQATPPHGEGESPRPTSLEVKTDS